MANLPIRVTDSKGFEPSEVVWIEIDPFEDWLEAHSSDEIGQGMRELIEHLKAGFSPSKGSLGHEIAKFVRLDEPAA